MVALYWMLDCQKYGATTGQLMQSSNQKVTSKGRRSRFLRKRPSELHIIHNLVHLRGM